MNSPLVCNDFFLSLQTAEEEEEERRRRMEEDKQDTEHNRILFNSLITVQEELLKQMRLKQVRF